MPTDWQSFDAYWQHILNDVLERNPTTDFTADIPRLKISAPPGVPRPVWALLRRPAMHTYLWLTIGTSPPRVRELQGLPWHRRDELLLRAVRQAIRHTWPLLPESLRYQPKAVQARRRKRLADTRQATTVSATRSSDR